MKRMSCILVVLVTFLAISGISHAGEEFVFPVGIWVTEDLRKPGWPFDIPAERLVDLRSKGVEMILLNGWYSGKKWYQIQGNIWFDSVMVDVAVLREKLARADSFGFLVYADPKSIDETLKYWGHDPEDTLAYFRYYDSEEFEAATFQDTLDSLVSWVVDSLNTYLQANDIQSLYRYIFWDEPFSKHVRAVRDTLSPWDDYWRNIWHHDDTTGWSTDTLGVYTFLKHKMEEKDTLHSVWINLGGSTDWHSKGKNSERGLCSLQVIPYGDTVPIPNPPHQFSFDAFPFAYGREIGDTSRVRERWTAIIDTIVVYAKSVDPSNPPPVCATQLQSFGSCNLDTFHWKRITIPEEVKELANLAVLHEVKGIMHFVLYSFAEKGDCWANLWDDDQVPFDAPYEEYVYNRDHDYFSDPDTLRPFCTNLPGESLYTDPFRELPPRPTPDSLNPKYLEEFYQWKYDPFARNYNALGEVNNQLHIMGNELLNLWRTQPVATIEPDSQNIFLPEIVTFSPLETSDIYLFFVNKDMSHSEMGFTVKMPRRDTLDGEDAVYPVPPHLESAHILDLSERHMIINRVVTPVYITFHVVLGAGEGKLVRLVEGSEAGDAMLADPDVQFYLVKGGAASTVPQHEFTEGDTIRLYATIYNLGFSSLNNLSVSFYDGHVDPSNLIRTEVVNLPALDTVRTLPAMAIAAWDWYASDTLILVHDINVQAVASGPGEEREENNHGHMDLLIHPEDYATAVVGDPWDMTEKEFQSPGEPSTADIDSFHDFTETPDSISGVWEAQISTLIPQPDPKIYLHLPDSIDGSKYNQFSIRFTQIPSAGEGYLKLGWLASDMTSGSDSALYAFDRWNVEEFDWSNNAAWTNKQITTLWVRPDTLTGTQFRLAWVKLTTEP